MKDVHIVFFRYLAYSSQLQLIFDKKEGTVRSSHQLFVFFFLLNTYFALLLLLDGAIQGNGEDNESSEVEESKLPLQLAIVGRPNVGKSTLLNTLLQEDRVLVGPETGLTRDSIREHFEFQGRTIYLVNIVFPWCPVFNL